MAALQQLGINCAPDEVLQLSGLLSFCTKQELKLEQPGPGLWAIQGQWSEDVPVELVVAIQEVEGLSPDRWLYSSEMSGESICVLGNGSLGELIRKLCTSKR